MEHLSRIFAKAGLTVDNGATFNGLVNANTDTDRFLVADNGVLKFRTGAEILSDIGGASSASGLPIGGTAGQILAKIDATNYNTEWIDNFTTDVRQYVKAGEAINKGQAVYISSADGTNPIVSKASNASEATSSKTLGLLAQNLSHNGFGYVITEGRLSGLDTSSAQIADPVWLGTNGNLIFGLANKPIAPAHLVYLGVVTRVNQNNGEIFVHVQNGVELNEIHDVLIQSVANKDILYRDASTNLWKNASIATVLGFTPADNAALANYQLTSQKAQPNGYASLDGNGKVPLAQMNDSIIGQVEYMGLWNAATNTPTLSSTPQQKGHYYIVSAAGTQFGITFEIGDWIISDGTTWSKVDNTDAVSSVFGRVGNVAAAEADYQSFYPRLSQVYANPSWISELAWSKITGTPTTISGYGITDAITGSGTDTQVVYWTGSKTQSGSNNFIWSNNKLSITGGLGVTGNADLGGAIRIGHTDTPVAFVDIRTAIGQEIGLYVQNGGGTGTRYAVLAQAQQTNPAVTNIAGYFNAQGGGTNYAIRTDNGDVILNYQSGSTLIGTLVNAGYKVDINGTLRVQNSLTISNNGNLITTNQFYGLASNFANGLFVGYDASAVYLGYQMGSTPIHVGTGGSGAFIVKTSGGVTVDSFAGTGTRMVVANSSGVLSTQAIPAGTVTSVGLTTGISGTDVNVSGSPVTGSGVITLNIPNASTSARGLVTTGTQSFSGQKTFNSLSTIFDSNESSTNLEIRAGGVVYGRVWGGLFVQFDATSSATNGFLWKIGSGSNAMALSQAGILTVNNLSGTGTRMVVADSSGVLSTQAIPSLSGYVPYSGATTNVDLNNQTLSAGLVYVEGQGGNGGQIGFKQYVGSSLVGLSGYNTISSITKNTFVFSLHQSGTDYKRVQLQFTNVPLSSVAVPSLELPSTSGTLALTSNITSAINGTTNWIPRFTSANTIGLSNLYDGSSFIGVFTATDNLSGAKLQVNGAATFSGSVTSESTGLNASLRIKNNTASTGKDWHLYSLNNGNFGLYNNTDGSYAYQVTPSGNLGLGVQPSAWWSGARSMQIGLGGSIAARTSSDFAAVELSANQIINASAQRVYIGTGFASLYEQFDGAHKWLTAPSGTAGNAITFTQAMTLTASGNLAIQAGKSFQWGERGQITQDGSWNFSWNTNSVSNAFYLQSATGNVGIGTATPDLTLTINGAMNLRNSTRAGAMEIDSTGNLWLGTATTLGNIYLETGHSTSGLPSTGTARMSILGSGNVGIGTIAPAARLDVQANVGVDGYALASYPFLRWSSGDVLDYGAFGNTWQALRFLTGGSERLRITSSGNVGIGTTSPLTQLHVNDGVNVSNLTILTLSQLGNTGNRDVVNFRMSFNNGNTPGIMMSAVKNSAAGTDLTLSTGADANGALSEKMRITSGGNVGIGTASPAVPLTVMANTGGNAVRLLGRSADGFAFLTFRNNADNATNGEIGISDAQNMLFYIGASERMRITSSGRTLIGTTTDNTVDLLQVAGSVIATGNILTKAASGGYQMSFNAQLSTQKIRFDDLTGAAYGVLAFEAGNGSGGFVERMRITSGGDVLVGMTSNTGSSTASVRAGLFSGQRTASGDTVFQAWNQGTTGDNKFVEFYTEGGAGTFRGSIDYNRASGVVRYNTTSDYRLKTDLKQFSGNSILDLIKVYDYQLKETGSRAYGVIAHELQEVLPYAVTGVKDGEQMQGVDYSKIVPVLVKAIQELKTELDTLKK